jgi:hypothetical protein
MMAACKPLRGGGIKTRRGSPSEAAVLTRRESRSTRAGAAASKTALRPYGVFFLNLPTAPGRLPFPIRREYGRRNRVVFSAIISLSLCSLSLFPYLEAFSCPQSDPANGCLMLATFDGSCESLTAFGGRSGARKPRKIGSAPIWRSSPASAVLELVLIHISLHVYISFLHVDASV